MRGVYSAGLIVGALQGTDKETLLSPRYGPTCGLWEREPLSPRIDAIAAGSFKTRQPPAIRGSGYVVHALEAALWAFHQGENFAEGALLAVNLGEDADTTGAIYGQLAGAYYGVNAIPERWGKRIALRLEIEQLATQLRFWGKLRPVDFRQQHQQPPNRSQLAFQVVGR